MNDLVRYLNETFEEHDEFSLTTSYYFRNEMIRSLAGFCRTLVKHYLYIRFLSKCKRYTFDYHLRVPDGMMNYHNELDKLSVLISFWRFLTTHQETEDICRFYSKIRLRGTYWNPSIEFYLNSSAMSLDRIQRDFNPNHPEFSDRHSQGLIRFPLPEIEAEAEAEADSDSDSDTDRYHREMTREFVPRRTNTRIPEGLQSDSDGDDTDSDDEEPRRNQCMSVIVNGRRESYEEEHQIHWYRFQGMIGSATEIVSPGVNVAELYREIYERQHTSSEFESDSN
jgi:hypothetical protein